MIPTRSLVNLNTPLELAIVNEIDRFSLAIDVIDRVPKLRTTGSHAKEKFRMSRSLVASTRTSMGSTNPKWSHGAGRSSAWARTASTNNSIVRFRIERSTNEMTLLRFELASTALGGFSARFIRRPANVMTRKSMS